MVRDRIVTRDAMPPDGAIKTTTTLSSSNSWIGALQASHYQTLEILKRVAIGASLFAVVWLLWFVGWQTRQGVSLAEGNLHSTYSGPSASLDSSPKATGRRVGVETSVHVYAFRLVGGSNHCPDALGSTGTSGRAFYYASSATGNHDTFGTVGR